jgi:hypothetical protein
VILIQAQEWEQIECLLTPRFKKSFSLANAITAIEQMRPQYPSEKDRAKSRIDKIAAGVRARWSQTVEGQITQAEYLRFTKILDF